MRLPNRYFRPFDQVYAAVTADIQRHAASLSGADQDWLGRLVVTFLEERKLWNDRPELTGYRAIWSRLGTPLLRLAAGAYLHVAYDLPRAMADDWPGRGRWRTGPSARRGEGIFMALAPIFPRHFQLALGMGWLPLGLFTHYLDAPMDRLRRGAWAHARILATAPGRARREAAMAAALTAGLQDAWDWRPWKIQKFLRPPDGAVFTVASLPLLAIISGSSVVTGLTVAVVLWALFELRIRAFQDQRSHMEFITVWGDLVADYVEAAVEKPEGFERYRRDRRVALGLDVAG